MSADLAARVRAREYSYCSCTYRGADGWPRWERFLVWTPSKPEARRRALGYCTGQWGEPFDIWVSPRNYITEARRLLAQGRHEKVVDQ